MGKLKYAIAFVFIVGNCLVPSGAMAADSQPLSVLVRSLEQDRAASLAKLDFLARNGGNCSRYFERVNSDVIQPFRQRLLDGGPVNLQSADALANLNRVHDNIELIRKELAATRMVGVRRDTGHNFLMLTFAADPAYPACQPTRAGDVSSTPESLAYQNFLTNLNDLDAKVLALRARLQASQSVASAPDPVAVPRQVLASGR